MTQMCLFYSWVIFPLLSILHTVMHMFPYHSVHLSHPLLPPLFPQVCSLCLHLHCCPANRFIRTIFLDSTYMCVNMWYLFFSFWPTSLCIIDSRFIYLIILRYSMCSFSQQLTLSVWGLFPRWEFWEFIFSPFRFYCTLLESPAVKSGQTPPLPGGCSQVDLLSFEVSLYGLLWNS